MSMFTNYQAELLKNYQPNNIVSKFSVPLQDSKIMSTSANKPYEEFDAKGNIVGYSWYNGETINLEFSIEGEITIEPDAFTTFRAGETPDGLSVATAGIKYYNLTDYRSWRSCLVDTETSWIEDPEFTYPVCGVDLKSMYVPADSYLNGRSVTVTMYDFRMRPVHTWNPEVHNSKVICKITPEIATKLSKGVYRCSVTVSSTDSTVSIFGTDDCLFLVK